MKTLSALFILSVFLISFAKANEVKDKQLLCVNDNFPPYSYHQEYIAMKFENQKLDFFITDSEMKYNFNPTVTDFKIRNQVIFFSILDKDNEIAVNYKLDRRRLILEDKKPKGDFFRSYAICKEVGDALMELTKVKSEYINQITKDNKI